MGIFKHYKIVEEDTPIDFPYDTVVYAPGYGYNTNQASKVSGPGSESESGSGSGSGSGSETENTEKKPMKNPIQFPSATSKFVRFLGHFWAIIGPWLALASWHVCPGLTPTLTPFCVFAVPILSVTFLRQEFSSFGSGSGSGSGSGTESEGEMMMQPMRPMQGGRRPCPPGTPNARPGQFCIGNRPIAG